jgi:hypothetical protein
MLEFPDDDDDGYDDLATTATAARTSFSSNASSTAFDEDEFQEKEEAILGQLSLAGSSDTAVAPSTPASTAHPTLREHHFENDGVVPMFSQWHPGDCEYVPFPFLRSFFLSSNFALPMGSLTFGVSFFVSNQ